MFSINKQSMEQLCEGLSSNVTCVSQGVCNTIGYFHKYHKLSILAPRSTVCPDYHSEVSKDILETAQLLVITMAFGLLFLAFIMYRSMSRKRVDYYRLMFLYIVGTLGVPLSILIQSKLAPSGGAGFSRVAGFGILTHNFAELFLLGHIWMGGNEEKPMYNSTFIILCIFYVWILLVAIGAFPLPYLFYLLMFQGAFMDFTLVMTFCILGRTMETNKKFLNDCCQCCQTCFGCLCCCNLCNKYGLCLNFGVIAAIMHIASLQPLFFGFATANLANNGYTIVFLMPTFMIYMLFTIAASKPKDGLHFIKAKGIDIELGTKLSKLAKREIGAINKKIKDDLNINDNNDAKDASEDNINDDSNNNNNNNNSNNDPQGPIIYAKNSLHGILANGLYRTLGPKRFNWLCFSILFGVVASVADSILAATQPCRLDGPSNCPPFQ